jgi:hypothetical protein
VVEKGRSGNVTSLVLRSMLPIVQEVLTRRHQMVDGENVVYVESELESLLAFDRPVVWAEHATIGAPFLAPLVTVVDLSAGPSQTRPYGEERRSVRGLASGKDFTWPMAPMTDGQMRDVRMAPANPDMMDHTTTLMESRNWFRHRHQHRQAPDRRLGVPPVEFPWVQIWRTIRKARHSRAAWSSPRNRTMCRGGRLSRSADVRAPTYRWLLTKSKIGARFLLFYARAPEG